MSGKLIGYRKNIYSQNGEDGVVSEICRRLDIYRGWFCEFGAWDGKYGSNTYALLKRGWKGVMIEGNPSRFKVLARTAAANPDKLIIQEAYVSHADDEYRLDNLLGKTPIPHNFAVLSIDIDSYDYHVWQSLMNYRPKLVIIEIDSSTLPGINYVFNGTGRLTSFSAMLHLGHEKRYKLVCHTGNLFFVANEYIDKLDIDLDDLANPENLFIHDWVNPSRYKTILRKIRNMTWQRAAVKVENMVREHFQS